MYNSGGAIEAMDFVSDRDRSLCRLSIKGRGSGLFGAYSSVKPKVCTVNSTSEEFMFKDDNHMLTLTIPSGVDYWEICVCFDA